MNEETPMSGASEAMIRAGHQAGEEISGGIARRVRRGAMQSKPVRQFTVYISAEDFGKIIDADTINTAGDWFTLSLRGHIVYGAPKERVFCYTASEVSEEAA